MSTVKNLHVHVRNTLKKATSLIMATLILIAVFPIVNNTNLTAEAADASVLITKQVAQSRVNDLVSRLNGKYFTTTGKAVYSNKNSECYNVNVINTSWFKSAVDGKVPSSYSLMPEHYYTKTSVITNNAWSCAGFANYCLWYIYSSSNSDNVRRVNVYTGKFNKANLDSAKLWPGDVIRVADRHSMVYLSHNSSGVTVLDSNYDSNNRIMKRTIPYSWRANTTMACTRGKNYTTASNNNAYYYLDLNGYLDGSYRDNISGIATADVYVNGRKVANDVSDYYTSWKNGSTYTITDIRAKSGYVYNGASSYSGTITQRVNVDLSFSKAASYTSVNFKMKSGAYTNAYSNANLSSKVGRIYTGDLITITRVYNNGVVRLSCPWSGGTTKTVYARASEIKFKATKYVNAYSAVNGSYVGRVYPQDLVVVQSFHFSSGTTWMKASCPWTGGVNKTIYIRCNDIY